MQNSIRLFCVKITNLIGNDYMMRNVPNTTKTPFPSSRIFREGKS
ncbi:hypothetical protein [Pedobacter mendelii]|nr:hypothetical protein [Pedobacter mendelii]